jgi:hypothetical protein
MTIIDQVERVVTETINMRTWDTWVGGTARRREAERQASLLAAMQRHIHAVPASTR